MVSLLRLGFLVFLLGRVHDVDARDAQGKLNNIITPNNGVPAIASPGSILEAVMRTKSEISLDDGIRTIGLDAEWSDGPGQSFTALCTLPKDIAAGTYTIVATSGPDVDRNARSVYVYALYPKEYAIIHLSDLRIRSSVQAADPRAFADTLSTRIDSEDIAFVLATGNLTESGSEEEFVRLLEVIDAFGVPTFLNPGTRDIRRSEFAKYFGNPTYAFRYGFDGFLSIDTTPDSDSPVLGPSHSMLQGLRKKIKPARWSIGFSYRPVTPEDIRTALILFEDDPLDYLVSGAAGPGDTLSPWPNYPTIHFAIPKDLSPRSQIIDVRLFQVDRRVPDATTP